MIKLKQISVLALFFILTSALFYGCATPVNDADTEVPGGGIPAPPPSAATVEIYVPTLVNDELRMERKRAPAEGDSRIDVMQALADFVIDGQRLFPTGTTVMGFDVSEGIATVDFSGELRGFSGGSMQEAGAVNAIVLTAAQFEGVNLVLITVEGQELESLGGHFDLTVPYEPDWSLLVEEN